MTERMILTFLLFGFVGVGWVESVRWVRNRQQQLSQRGVSQASLSDDRKRELIKSWRDMLVEIAGKYPIGKPANDSDVSAKIQRHPAFQTLRPLLGKEALAAIYNPGRIFIVGPQIPTVLVFVQRDIDRIEELWGLRPQGLVP